MTDLSKRFSSKELASIKRSQENERFWQNIDKNQNEPNSIKSNEQDKCATSNSLIISNSSDSNLKKNQNKPTLRYSKAQFNFILKKKLINLIGEHNFFHVALHKYLLDYADQIIQIKSQLVKVVKV